MNNESRPYRNAVRALSLSIAFFYRRNPLRTKDCFFVLRWTAS